MLMRYVMKRKVRCTLTWTIKHESLRMETQREAEILSSYQILLRHSKRAEKENWRPSDWAEGMRIFELLQMRGQPWLPMHDPLTIREICWINFTKLWKKLTPSSGIMLAMFPAHGQAQWCCCLCTARLERKENLVKFAILKTTWSVAIRDRRNCACNFCVQRERSHRLVLPFDAAVRLYAAHRCVQCQR